MSNKKQVKIGETKGRPMLYWVGKRPLDYVTAYPAQMVEVFNPVGEENEAQGLLFHGDNKDVLAWLLAHGYRGKVNLVYIDPPFDSGADYVRRVRLRGIRRTARMEGETYGLGEQIQYTDIWANDAYLQFMYNRLLLIKELLSEEQGFIGLQCDWRKAHHLRCILDEIFGGENFRGEILIRAGTKNVQSQFDEVSSLTTGNNSIFLYTRSSDTRLRKLVAELEQVEPGKWDTFWRGTDRPTLRYELFGQLPADGQWRWTETRTKKAAGNYRQYLEQFADRLSLDEYYFEVLETRGEELDFVRKDESGTIQYYVPPRNYRLLSNVWFDLPYRGTRTDYPTEKHEAPITRLTRWLTTPGDLVLDCFAGSGTTVAVAQRLGRRWIAADINKGAVQTTSRRLQTIIYEQIESGATSLQPALGLTEQDSDETPPRPALSFSVCRVNDYDLQVQHNEAANLAVELVGIERVRTDPFFDGTRGKQLVKVIPFNHPLTPLDLQLIQDELRSRPDEERDVLVVCLGKELAVDGWLETYNKRRPINKIEIVELRTDQRYGKFFVHQPAQAQVRVTRVDEGKIVVEIEDFISPTIVERLEMDTPLFKAQIPDWRAMVDVVMIDTAYDGEVFNIALSDVPERKDDLVTGRYELSAPAGQTTVAVKIIDMLGEEVLVATEV